MRISTEEEAKHFELFNKELSELSDIDPLKEINSKTPHVLQIIAFHLTFEYLVEKWIDYKINFGNPLFSGIEKIGFHNKLYISKNIGLPKEIFKALNRINDERNKFAHQISKKIMKKEEILEIAKMADSIECTGAKFDDLGVYENGILINSSKTNCEKALLLLALHSVLGKVRNFVFSDIHLDTSREYNLVKSPRSTT